MSRIEVVYTATRNLYPWLPASYTSLLDHNPDAHVWMLIEDDALPYETPENIEVVNIRGQTIFGPGCPNWRSQFTYMSLIRVAYSKMFTGEPNEVGIRTLPKLDRILQLDVDTIVCDDLTPIWETDLDGKWFAAAPDYLAYYRPFGRQKYYNLGVAVFNLEQVRLDRADDEAIYRLNTVRMQFIDEMVFNQLNNELGNRMSSDFEPRYNQTSEVEQTDDPAVVHYAGTVKWWQDFRNMYRPYYMLQYAKYFQNGSGSVQKKKVVDFTLNIRENGMVRYMMENGDYPVRNEMSFYDAMKRLKLDKVRIGNMFPGYPITTDNKFYFEGTARWVNMEIPTDGVELGADGLPIPAKAE